MGAAAQLAPSFSVQNCSMEGTGPLTCVFPLQLIVIPHRLSLGDSTPDLIDSINHHSLYPLLTKLYFNGS